MTLLKNIIKNKGQSRGIITCLSGIGNPEPQYAGTRHNVGLQMLDLVISHLRPESDNIEYKQSRASRAVKYIQLSPTLVALRCDGNYINVSGESLIPVWKRLGIAKHIVFHDDLTLPLGKVQLREPGTSLRGHNGLKDISRLYGNSFHKLSIGIGRPESHAPDVVAAYVLDKLTLEENDILLNQSLPAIMNKLVL